MIDTANARDLVQRMRRMSAALNRIVTEPGVQFSVDLSRAYKRRRYSLSVRQFQGGLCVRSGTLILLDMTRPEVWARPAAREGDRTNDAALDAYRWLVRIGQVSSFMAACEGAGVELQRYSTTLEALEAYAALMKPAA